MSLHYKIGTRGSLLAVTQCTLIKNEITALTGAEFELNLIKTQGDQITDKPLWQLEGKDFFTKELDAALLLNEVDLVVHSYKDLGSERPEGISLATITKRQYAHDILLIKKETISKLTKLDELIVGTSSPRRIVNIEANLNGFIPRLNKNAKVKCVTLRGNVNTRIQKLKDDNYHAIVLALAGIERLAHKEESRHELTKLLEGLTFLILPQKTFPSSASQGALAIEYNGTRNDQVLLKTLQSVHCQDTASEISRERKAFVSYGGGCHLAVGIHVRKFKDFYLHIHKGQVDNNLINYTFLEGVDYKEIEGKKSYIVLGKKDVLIDKVPLQVSISENSNIFVTSQYCISPLKMVNSKSIWASGNMTHKKLNEEGFWVNGNAEGLGHGEIQNLLSSAAIQIMLKDNSVTVLSHDEANSEIGEVKACYTHKINDFDFDYEKIEIFFWSSFYQYQVYTKKYPEIKNKYHACGLGKTYDQFIEKNIKIFPFADMESFRQLTEEV